MIRPAEARNFVAEFLGTAFLLAGIIGSGIMADRLSTDTGLTLLHNAIATGAVTVARAISDTFTGIEPASVAPFVVAQLLATAVAVGVIRFLFPQIESTAADVVVPHHPAAADRDGQGHSRSNRPATGR